MKKLFNQGDLQRSLEMQAERMREVIEHEPEENLKQADVGEWAAALASHFAVSCPELKTDDITRDPPEDIEIDVSWDRSRYFSDYDSDYAHHFPGYRIVVRVPFVGDETVFQLQPSSFTLNPPRGASRRRRASPAD